MSKEITVPVTLLADVPASYFFFLWTKRDLEKDKHDPVAIYIRKNLDTLRKEYSDGIW